MAGLPANSHSQRESRARAPGGLCGGMSEEPAPGKTPLAAWAIGAAALGAWFTLLWFMFADVL